MSEPYEYGNDQLDDLNNEYGNDETEQEPGFVKRLRKDASEGKKAAARLAELEAEMAKTRKDQQELAMRRAGIDLDSPLAQMFAKANSDLVDVDTIKAEWEKIAASAGPSAAEQDAQAMNRINAAQAGSAPGGGAVPDFEAELDEIPMLVDDEWNPNYVQQVLQKAQEQAAREGKQFVTSTPGRVTWQTSGPATTPLG